MQNTYSFQTTVKWNEGLTGTISAPQLSPFIVATPPEFKNGVPNTWSPEHLFVASVNICLMTTFIAVAANSKLDVTRYLSDAVGVIEKIDGKFMFSRIELKPTIHIKFEKDFERAERILKKAENLCLVSNSIKSGLILTPKIIT